MTWLGGEPGGKGVGRGGRQNSGRTGKVRGVCGREGNGLLTLRPSIWLIAADSLSVHSSITVCLISFMNTMNALRGFLMWWPVLRARDAADMVDGLRSEDVERVDVVDWRDADPDCCLQRSTVPATSLRQPRLPDHLPLPYFGAKRQKPKSLSQEILPQNSPQPRCPVHPQTTQKSTPSFRSSLLNSS